jgi:hypothetical protein
MMPTTKRTSAYLPVEGGNYAPVYILETVDAVEAATTMKRGMFENFPPAFRELNGIMVPVIAVVADADLAGGGRMVKQEVRTAGFTLAPTDSNSEIPVTGNNPVVLSSTSKLTGPVIIRRYAAGTAGAKLALTQSGAVAWDVDQQAAWGTLEVTGLLSSIIIYPGDSADRYEVRKIGV